MLHCCLNIMNKYWHTHSHLRYLNISSKVELMHKQEAMSAKNGMTLPMCCMGTCTFIPKKALTTWKGINITVSAARVLRI